MRDPIPIPIVDCHVHFIDEQAHAYPVFQERSLGFEALVGDYSSMPRRYLPAQYFSDANGLKVVRTVWAEFMSTDAVGEVQWAETLSAKEGVPDGIVAVVNFLSPDVERVLNVYGSLKRVRAVREHLAWHPRNPLLRFAPRPDVLSDEAWRKRIALLRRYDLRCEIEMFAPQLPDFEAVVSLYQDIQFIVPLMGWPIDVTAEGHSEWKHNMKILSKHQNVAVKIFGMECIFGIGWKLDQVRPWILDTVELFGPERCMFASHMPIAKLARTFQNLYAAYFEVVSDFSPSEKQDLFHDTAIQKYGLEHPDPLA